jgi:hypothetical protein
VIEARSSSSSLALSKILISSVAIFALILWLILRAYNAA